MTLERIGSLVLIAAGLAGGCATVPAGPGVTAMPGTSKSFAQFERDDAACRQFASQQAATTPERAAGIATAERAGIGTLIGAGLGAAIGAIGHNPGLGAAAGAGAGLLAGTAVGAGAGQRAAADVQHRYDAAYEQCMYANGNQVPGPPAQPAVTPPPPAPR
jgi:Glycine-zipper domain